MSRRQRRAAEVMADIERLALRGLVVTVTWDRSPGGFTASIRRAKGGLMPSGEADWHAHSDTLDEAVRACAAHFTRSET